MTKLKEKAAKTTEAPQSTQKRRRVRDLLSDPITYCLIGAALLFSVYVASDIFVGLTVYQKIAVNIILFAALYVLGAIRAKQGDARFIRVMYLVMLLCYTYFLISATLLDASLGRGSLESIKDAAARREHYDTWFVNLVPFHTVKTIYIDALRNGYVTLGYVIFNALGNLLILAPLTVLIGASSKRLSKPYLVLPIILATTLAIEALQYVFMRGSCDVDDVIFNFVGALAVWAILEIPPIKRFAKKIMFL